MVFFVLLMQTQAESQEPEQISSADSLVHVQAPANGPWSCVQSRQSQDDEVVTFIKCRLEGEGNFFILMARDHQYSGKPPKNAKDVVQGRFKKSYAQLYNKPDYLRAEEVDRPAPKSYEIEFQALHPRTGAIQKLERVSLAPGHILVLSAEGLQSGFEAMRPTFEAWFATVRFSALQ